MNLTGLYCAYKNIYIELYDIKTIGMGAKRLVVLKVKRRKREQEKISMKDLKRDIKNKNWSKLYTKVNKLLYINKDAVPMKETLEMLFVNIMR